MAEVRLCTVEATGSVEVLEQCTGISCELRACYSRALRRLTIPCVDVPYASGERGG